MSVLARIDTFSDEEFSEIVAKSHNMMEISVALGYAAKSGSNYQRIRKRIDSLGLSTDHFTLMNKRPVKRTVDNIFIENSTADQKTLRKWFFEGQYMEYKCDICGQKPIWNNLPLTLILDHKNGHNHDDRLENLHWVCPNCNQQLPTTNGKNIKRLKEEKAQI
jgi:Zn finger protein HypA/HybF involved in hydrogenase expression